MSFFEQEAYTLEGGRKEKIISATNELRSLLDRTPPPSYGEVAEAIDKIARENDRA